MMQVLPTSYFGSIAYFRELAKHSEVLIEAKEHFPKQTYRNRCDLLAGDGIVSLSIPTKRPFGNKTLTEDILLSDDENWRVRHWRSITSAYQSSAYFDYYGMEVEEILFNEEKSLLKFNTAITERILKWLYIDVEIKPTTDFHPMNEDDLRISLVHKDGFQEKQVPPYIQVFPGNESYQESLSILDAIFCEGPMARKLIIPNE